MGWTTRWNAFYDDSNRPSGWKKFDSDGEGLLIEKGKEAQKWVLDQQGASENILNALEQAVQL